MKPPEPLRYSLCREAGCWVLLFKDGRAYLKPEIGLFYVGCLFLHHDEPVPSAKLFSRFSTGHRKDIVMTELPDPKTGLPEPVADGVGIARLPSDKDEAEARSRYSAQLRAYRETFSNPSIPEPERAEARRLYDEMRAFLKQHYRPASDAGRHVTRQVHRSIQRLCDNLRKPVAGQGVPDAIAEAFAEYIEHHIVVPSRRYTRARAGANVRIARGELAGRLIFERPAGHRWLVRL